MKAINVKKALGSMREKCFGMPEEVYRFAKYLSANMNDQLVSAGVVLAIATALDDVKNGRSGLGHEFPDYFVKHKEEVLDRAKFVLQIIDETVDEDFADEVRAGCEEAFGWKTTKRAKISDRETLAERFDPCIMVAVEWWTTRIQLGDKADWAEDVPGVYKEFTEEEMGKFRCGLATRVEAELFLYGRTQLMVDYHPDKILRRTLEEAGVDDSLALFILPKKTTMYVEEDKVEVMSGWESAIIWKEK